MGAVGMGVMNLHEYDDMVEVLGWAPLGAAWCPKAVFYRYLSVQGSE